jgi:hypothetical protein
MGDLLSAEVKKPALIAVFEAASPAMTHLGPALPHLLAVMREIRHSVQPTHDSLYLCFLYIQDRVTGN